jgi:hypothetical protein
LRHGAGQPKACRSTRNSKGDEVEVDDDGGWYPEVEFEAYFVDMHGRRWKRRPTGQPERVWKWAADESSRADDEPTNHPAD